MKKISLPLVVTIMCVMISVVLGMLWINKGKEKKTGSSQSETENIVRTDYSEVARKTLDWIDEQRNDEGWYILERGCDFDKKTCDTVWDNDEGNKDGLIATWARFNYYQQTKNPEDLAIVKSDIDKFYEKYSEGVDNALWICKITYDMWNSGLFNEETKDKLQNICFKSNFLSVSETDGLETKNFDEREDLVPGGGTWKTWDGYRLVLRGFSDHLGYGTDFVSMYRWMGDQKYLDLAREYVEMAKKEEDAGKGVLVEDSCLLGLSSLDLFEYGGEDYDDFNYAVNLYDKLVSRFNDPKRVATPICGLLVKRLSQLTENQEYLSKLESLRQSLVEFNNDNNNGVNKVVADNGFWRSNLGVLWVWRKNVVENGLIVELMRN